MHSTILIELKKIVFLVLVLVFLSTAVIVRFVSPVISYPPETEFLTEIDLPVHNIDSGKNFSTIQEAIDHNETLDGHTIMVNAGTYYEYLIIDKSLKFVGENRNTTFIMANETTRESTITVTANNVSIERFTIQNDYFPESGIYVYSCSNVTIANNVISGEVSSGIHLNFSSDNLISDNVVRYAGVGIDLERCDGNRIIGNRIEPMSGLDQVGILLAYSSTENVIIGNSISDNGYYGIRLVFDADYNTIIGNNLRNNDAGIDSYQSGDNIIYHNNFINNARQVSFTTSNFWDNGVEGNYWSDYPGNDTYGDGIGDTPYIIDENDRDRYPLMGLFTDFNVVCEEEIHHVTTICNSTISEFQFTDNLTTIINGVPGTWLVNVIVFNVSGEDGTLGFCRICIPMALMNEPYEVFVKGTWVPYTLLPCSNSTHNYLYFTYNHSTQEVVIIPEFPTWTPMLLILIVFTVAIATYKRRLSAT